MTNQTIRDAVIAAGREKADELEIPFEVPLWLHNVPEDKQEGAMILSLIHYRRKIERDMEVQVARDARKAERKSVFDAILSKGYNLFYEEVGNFVIAVAYKVVREDLYGKYVNAYFSVCTSKDRKLFSRERARRNLLDRINRNDPRYAFVGVIPSDDIYEQVFVWHRLLERVTIDPGGMPHVLAKGIRLSCGTY